MRKKSKKFVKKKKSAKSALVLFSGGLDSILAVKILEKEGIAVRALTFTSYFFDAGQAKKSARENNISLMTKDISKSHFGIVKNPCYGRGAGMNPCVDCHLLMLKVAKKIMRRDGYDFIATGEVLVQRPMSQNAEALKLIERESGLVGKIIRPLSEKILHPRAELSGKMYGISGRGRKEQMELAKKFGVRNYPTPAGGCILTDKEYSRKLGDLIEKVKITRKSDLDLLRIGRHFWAGNTRIILGRNHEENLKIKKLADLPSEALAKEGKGDTLIELKNIPGPTALVRGKNIEASIEASIEAAKKKILKYAKKADKKKIMYIIKIVK